jgi:MFS family permease
LPLGRRARRLAGTFMVVLDFFIVNVALPAMQGDPRPAARAGPGRAAGGVVFTIMAAAYLAASMPAPGLIVRLGRRVRAAGALVLAAGHALLAVSVADVGTRGPVGLLVPALLLIAPAWGWS